MGCHFLLQGIFPTQGSNPHEEEDSLRYRKDWRRAENKSRNSRGSGDGVARAKGNRWESTRYLCGWRQRRGWGVGQRVPRNQRRPREKGVPYRDQQENVETSQQREHLRDFPANPVVMENRLVDTVEEGEGGAN